ncbi:centromere protein K [Amblyraja radiata]|uniref:centromere protein K n=1 Tax=Amblyraja radiata TaxID=386614 RepID=UPI001402E052|nr:centromere protein K [Amblyraja radiata]
MERESPNSRSQHGALDELQDELIQEVQNKLTLCDARTLIQDSENPLAVLLARERALLAELNVQKSREPELLLVNQEVLTSLGKQELQNTDRQLEQMLSCVRAKKKSLHEQLERERKWLDEEREIETSLQQREEDGQMVCLLQNSPC